MKHSTAVPRDFSVEFHENPINSRVLLPDGTLAVVKRFEDTDQGRIYKVQGIHRNGRFRKLDSVSCWFTANELRVFYYSASIHPDWVRS